VLFEARKYGIKMILSLVNYYHDYGGRKQYVDWVKGQGGRPIYLTMDSSLTLLSRASTRTISRYERSRWRERERDFVS
jgi:endo-1,4-beta-mannosidase